MNTHKVLKATLSRDVPWIWPLFGALTAWTHVKSQASAREICGLQSGTGTGFLKSAFVLFHQYNSTRTPYSSPYVTDTTTASLSKTHTQMRLLGRIMSQKNWVWIRERKCTSSGMDLMAADICVPNIVLGLSVSATILLETFIWRSSHWSILYREQILIALLP